MWTWTCSGCGDTFSHSVKTKAQQLFFDHVAQAHPTAAVISIAPPNDEDTSNNVK